MVRRTAFAAGISRYPLIPPCPRRVPHVTKLLRSLSSVRLAAPPQTVEGRVEGPVATERGRFRVSALAPGEYVVVASELIAHVASSDTQPATPSTLALTYYPSEVKAEKASVVALAEGEEREDIDITLVERETHTISGLVRSRRDGGPVSGARVRFVARGTAEESTLEYMAYFAYSPNVVTTDEQGRWRFEEMPDGDYIIHVTPPPNISNEDDAEEDTNEEGEPEQPAKAEAAKPRPTPKPKPKGYAPARQPVTVAGNDVSDLVLTLGDEGKIAGNITAEGGKQPPNVYVVAHPQPSEPGATFYSNVSEGAFEIGGLPPGKYSLYVGSYDNHLYRFDLAGGQQLTPKRPTRAQLHPNHTLKMQR